MPEKQKPARATLGVRIMARDAEIKNLRKLVKDMEAVIEDFMPNIGKCALQNYALLNDVLLRAKKVKT